MFRKEGEPIPREKFIVEIGTSGWPVFKIGNRTIGEDELYTAIEQGLIPSSLIDVKEEAEKRGIQDRVNALEADGSALPFNDESVDEIILTNIIGAPVDSRIGDSTNAFKILKEASRVLKRGGKITITETWTPRITKEQMKIGDNQEFRKKLAEMGLVLSETHGPESVSLTNYDNRREFKTGKEFQIILTKI